MFLSRFQYSQKEWVAAKTLTILVWLGFCLRILFRFDSQPFPEGACVLFDCSFFTRSPVIYLSLILMIGLAVLYVLEKQMALVTFLISVFSIIFFSLEIANGGHSSRMEILSIVFIVQFIAYFQCLIFKSRPAESNEASNLAMMYSVQVIACAYVITGVCKLQESGLDWVMESQNFAVRAVRSYASRAIDFNAPSLTMRGKMIAEFILSHIFLTRILFLAALLVELFAFVAIFSKRNARIYAVIILLFHTGMFIMLGGVLLSFILLVFIYLFNLPGMIWKQNGIPLQEDLSSSPHGVNSSWTKLRLIKVIGSFIIPVSYFLLSFTIGEIHPFSRFPMFASATNSTEYYYLAKENRRPIGGLRKFHLSCGELKNMLYADAANKQIKVEDVEKMRGVATDFLNFIYVSGKAAEINPKHEAILLVRHTIALEDLRLVELEIIMARHP